MATEVVHVEHAHRLVRGGHERRAHRAPHVLHPDGLALESGIGRGILGKHRHLLLERLAGDRAGHVLGKLDVGQPGSREPWHQIVPPLPPQENRDPVHPHDLEGNVGDRVEQTVEIELARELVRYGEQERQLARGPLPLRDAPGRELPDDRLSPCSRRGRWGGWCGDIRCRRHQLEVVGHLSERDRVTGREPAGGQPASVHVGPVRRAKVLHHDAVRLGGQLGVTAGDRRVEDREIALDPASHDHAPALGQIEALIVGR